MDLKATASFEFAVFVAEVSDPGTGAILSSRLAEQLGMAEDCLLEDWHSSGIADWKEFADQVLALLDAMQDVTMSLSETVIWYRERLLLACRGWTPAQCIAQGAAREALSAVYALRNRGLRSPSSIQNRG